MTPRAAQPGDFGVSVDPASGPTAVMSVTGEVDIANSPVLDQQVEKLLGAGVTEITIDLSGVTFIDSTGLGVLARTHRLAAEAGGSLSVRGARQATRRVLEISGLTQIITLTDAEPSGPVS